MAFALTLYRSRPTLLCSWPIASETQRVHLCGNLSISLGRFLHLWFLCFPNPSRTRILYRNHIPWIIIGICYVSCACLLLIIRWLLARENARRDAEPVVEKEEELFIEKESEDGVRVQVKVDKV